MIATLLRIDLDALYEAARDLTTDLYPRLHALVPEATNQVTESQIDKTKGTTKSSSPGTRRPPTCTSTSTPRRAAESRR